MNTHKLMGFYMEGLVLGVNTMYMLFCFFKLFLVGCIGISEGKAQQSLPKSVCSLPAAYVQVEYIPLQIPCVALSGKDLELTT